MSATPRDVRGTAHPFVDLALCDPLNSWLYDWVLS